MPDDASRPGSPTAAIFLALFGTAWLVGWCLRVFGAEPRVLAPIALGALALVLAALRGARIRRRARSMGGWRTTDRRTRRLFHVVNATQWVLIITAARVLALRGRAEWIGASVIFVVGLHFLPLAALFRYRPYYLTGVALLALAVIYPLVAAAGPASPVGALGAGVILWASAVGLLTGRPSFPRAAG